MKCTLLNAGEQTDYLYGIVTGLAQHHTLMLDVVDSDASQGLFDAFPNVHHRNFRGDNRTPHPFIVKLVHILRYYIRLLWYVPRSHSDIFHIQWDNSFYLFDRTLLLLYYKLFGKKLVYTVHNVDRTLRDTQRSPLINRFSLFCAYHLVDHIITHTENMKRDLCERFRVPPQKVSVIPHGVNIFVRSTGITRDDARKKLSIPQTAKVILFFGMIDWYKGLDIGLKAFTHLVQNDPTYFFLIAGQPKRSQEYFESVRSYAEEHIPRHMYRLDAHFIPPEDVEQYFVAADCVLLPYRTIFQSGVLFLAYRFGIPVLATDVGSFRYDIVEGQTGFICEPNNDEALRTCIERFFASELYYNVEKTRTAIQRYANERYSWETIGKQTYQLYEQLLRTP